ncbi:anti-sigma factor family protein [Streptomyces aidingensis]|uniref:Putative zinc-finger n=1 Tax=Streptomyces aidingensis TaxID=910347 RepID=A0A1I1EUZ5_9ACTN|nr:zf-HC2 domain-containing protein [Streptomyces aidingensis]SFB90861.1 Putative zinc-finger [Streptomyces aidingensis]
MTSEDHLGDSLAALIDGELSDDHRERVLAHLATCPGCKAEADAQRRLKSVFADSALPTPPETLMARLQGLPALGLAEAGRGGAAGDESARGGGRPPGGGLPPGRGRSLLTPPSLKPERGFPIHRAGEPGGRFGGRLGGEALMPRAGRGQRLAFAAAGAFSLAAVALGGALTSAGTPTVNVAGGTGGGTGGAASAASASPAGTSATAVRTAARDDREDPSADRESPRSTGLPSDEIAEQYASATAELYGTGVLAAQTAAVFAGLAMDPELAELLAGQRTAATPAAPGPVPTGHAGTPGATGSATAEPAPQETAMPRASSPR